MIAPCVKFTIFMTPKMIINPAVTMNSMAAVLRMSSSNPIVFSGGRPARGRPAHALLQVGALLARVHVVEGLQDLDRMVRLHLAQPHGQGRVALARSEERRVGKERR